TQSEPGLTEIIWIRGQACPRSAGSVVPSACAGEVAAMPARAGADQAGTGPGAISNRGSGVFSALKEAERFPTPFSGRDLYPARGHLGRPGSDRWRDSGKRREEGARQVRGHLSLLWLGHGEVIFFPLRLENTP